jgi:hypothetical protein
MLDNADDKFKEKYDPYYEKKKTGETDDAAVDLEVEEFEKNLESCRRKASGKIKPNVS